MQEKVESHVDLEGNIFYNNMVGVCIVFIVIRRSKADKKFRTKATVKYR